MIYYFFVKKLKINLLILFCALINLLNANANYSLENNINKSDIYREFKNIVTEEYNPNINSQTSANRNTILINEANQEREWGVLVYIAADNDLHYFAWNNIKQLANGANKNMYITVQLNEPGKNKKTQLYLIEKNKAILLNKDNQLKLDTGDPQTLIDFCLYSIKNYPAKKYMLVLSDHGSGVADRYAARVINPSEFFLLNPSNLMLELDRSIEFLDFLEHSRYKNNEYDNLGDPKGLCFDETYQTYLTNQKLEYALKIICQEAAKLQKKEFKFAIFGMDACLMQMIEISDLIKNFANIVIASEEVELGPGWRYDKVLNILQNESIDHISFAKHIVKVYEDTYSGITSDYTLSAIDLEKIDELTTNINLVAENLIELLENQKDNSVRNLIRKAKTNIGFEEPSYVDYISFCINIQKNIDSIALKSNNLNKLKESLKFNIQQSLKILENIIIANVAGNNIKYARGLSIYFPERRIHNSYRKTNFAQNNQWFNLLMHYISF